MRSLILRGGALGDFLVTLPLLEALSLRFPGSHVELIGNRRAADLAIDAMLLAAAHDQHDARWAAFFSGQPLPQGLAAWLGSFDLVASFWPDPDGLLAKALRSAAKGRVILESAHPRSGPASQHYLSALKDYDFPVVSPVTRLRACRAEGRIAIHPGSGSPSKNWPRERWDAVSAALADKGPVVTIRGPAEEGPPLSRSSETWNHLPLPALADRLASCSLYLGNDSGISHLAASCGVPSVLLFQASDPSIWAPPSPGVRVLASALSLSPEHVLGVARSYLPAKG